MWARRRQALWGVPRDDDVEALEPHEKLRTTEGSTPLNRSLILYLLTCKARSALSPLVPHVGEEECGEDGVENAANFEDIDDADSLG